jgi:hypothetical protein
MKYSHFVEQSQDAIWKITSFYFLVGFWILTIPFHVPYDLTGLVFGFDAIDYGWEAMCLSFEPANDFFWDAAQEFTMSMFGCTKCDILRFRQAAGSNDYTITDMIAGLYANHEIILSGYNIFKGTPF